MSGILANTLIAMLVKAEKVGKVGKVGKAGRIEMEDKAKVTDIWGISIQISSTYST